MLLQVAGTGLCGAGAARLVGFPFAVVHGAARCADGTSKTHRKLVDAAVRLCTAMLMNSSARAGVDTRADSSSNPLMLLGTSNWFVHARLHAHALTHSRTHEDARFCRAHTRTRGTPPQIALERARACTRRVDVFSKHDGTQPKKNARHDTTLLLLFAAVARGFFPDETLCASRSPRSGNQQATSRRLVADFRFLYKHTGKFICGEEQRLNVLWACVQNAIVK